jgi:hypothetical protein
MLLKFMVIALVVTDRDAFKKIWELYAPQACENNMSFCQQEKGRVFLTLKT